MYPFHRTLGRIEAILLKRQSSLIPRSHHLLVLRSSSSFSSLRPHVSQRVQRGTGLREIPCSPQLVRYIALERGEMRIGSARRGSNPHVHAPHTPDRWTSDGRLSPNTYRRHSLEPGQTIQTVNPSLSRCPPATRRAHHTHPRQHRRHQAGR